MLRVELHRLAEGANRLVKLALPGEREAQVVARRGVLGIERGHLGVGCGGVFPAPLLEAHVTQRGVDLGWIFAALGGVFPLPTGPVLVLDVGANAEVRPSHLVQFARVGIAYMRELFGIADPSVGLLNIGVEDIKGNDVVYNYIEGYLGSDTLKGGTGADGFGYYNIGEFGDTMLDFTASARQAGSRLSCQIMVTDELDGLILHLPEQQ